MRVQMLALLMLALCARSAAALAQSSSGNASEADELIDRGLTAREHGEDEEALRLFTRAYQIRPTARATAQIAFAEQALGRWPEAEAHMVQALGARGDSWIEHNRALIEGALKSVRARLADLYIDGGLPGAEVKIDGRLVARLPLPGALRVSAGTFVVEVSLEGYFPVRRGVSVAAGGVARERIALVADPRAAKAPSPAAGNPPPEPPAPAPAIAVAKEEERPPASPGFTLRQKIGVGLLAGAGGALLLAILAHASYQGNAHDFNGAGCGTADLDRYAGCRDLYDAADGAKKRLIIGYAATAALAGAGGYLLWVSPAAGPEGGVASLTNPHGGGLLGVSGRF